MTRRRDASTGPARRAAELEIVDKPRESLFEHFLLLILLSLIPLRAILNEQASFEELRWFRYLNGPPGPMPGTTLLLAGVIASVGVALLALRLWRGGPYRRTGAEIGAALLLIAGVISYSRAGQKHLALVGTLDFLGLIVYFLLLSQLLLRPWHLRLALCTIAATGAMVLVKAAYQVWVELPDTIEYFKQYHAADMAQRLGKEGLGRMYDFERRLEGGAARGYFAHSNVFGSFLILIVMACFALARDRWRRVSFVWLIVPLLLAGISVIALAGSQSKGAAVALGIAVLAYVAGEWIRYFRRHASHRGAPFIATSVWIGFLAVAIGLVATLHSSPAALGRSMLFRWMYWQGAARMITDQGLLGVGANNFGRFFPRYKSVECPEEVQDPHSWPVRLLTEWGVLGLVGGIAIFVGITVTMARRGRAGAVAPVQSDGATNLDASTATGRADERSLVLWIAAIGAIAVGGYWLSMAGADPGYVAGALFLVGMPWVIGFLAIGLESSTPRLTNATPVVMAAPLCAGAIGFLLHTGVDLALFWPGAATTFFAILALAISASRAFREGEALAEPTAPCVLASGAGVPARHYLQPKPRRGLAVAAAMLGAFTIAFYFGKIVGPTIAVGAALDVARHDPGPPTWDEYARSPNRRAYEAAIVAERRDSTALDELLEALIARTVSPQQLKALAEGPSPQSQEAARLGFLHVEDIARRLPELRARDPQGPAADHYDATLHVQRFKLTGQASELTEAIAAMWNVVHGHPTAPDHRVTLAEMYAELWKTTADPAARDAAIEQYALALDLDARRIYVSPLNRYDAETRADLERRIAALRDPSPPTTNMTSAKP